MYHLCKTYCFLLAAFTFLLSNQLYSQSWVADTIQVNFGSPDTLRTNFLLEASENRDESRVISVFERKKLLFFPVDQVLVLENSLAQSFEKKFSGKKNSPSIKIGIERFYLQQAKMLNKWEMMLFTAIELREIQNDSAFFLGTIYYEHPLFLSSKLSVSAACESLIDDWLVKFSGDLVGVQNEVDIMVPGSMKHFRRDKYVIRKNLYTEVEAFAGLSFWGFDVSVWFSEPESNTVFDREIGLIRYVNHPDFQSIAFGRNIRLWNYRFSKSLLFSHKIAFLMGINKWNDIKNTSHRLEEIPLFDLSFTQRIHYNRFDEKGLVFGLGLMEDFHYIIYQKPKVNLGLTLNFAYKF